MDITFKINGTCASGGHIHITATANGKEYPLTFTRDQLSATPKPEEAEIYALILLRSFAKKSGLLGDLPALKIAIEAEVFKL